MCEAGFPHGRSTPPPDYSLSLKGVAPHTPSLACPSLTLRTDDSSREAGFCPLAGDMGAMMSTLVQGQFGPCAAYSTHHYLCYIPRVPVPGLLGTCVGDSVRPHYPASWTKGLISTVLCPKQRLSAPPSHSPVSHGWHSLVQVAYRPPWPPMSPSRPHR